MSLGPDLGLGENRRVADVVERDGLLSRVWVVHPGTWFRGGLVFKAHRLVYHSTLGLRVIKKKKACSLAYGSNIPGPDRGRDAEFVRDKTGPDAGCVLDKTGRDTKTT